MPTKYTSKKEFLEDLLKLEDVIFVKKEKVERKEKITTLPVKTRNVLIGIGTSVLLGLGITGGIAGYVSYQNRQYQIQQEQKQAMQLEEKETQYQEQSRVFPPSGDGTAEEARVDEGEGGVEAEVGNGYEEEQEQAITEKSLEERVKQPQPTYDSVSLYLSGGSYDRKGHWVKQPYIEVNGERFSFDTPQGYINQFNEIKNEYSLPPEHISWINNNISNYQEIADKFWSETQQSQDRESTQQQSLENKVEETNYQLGYHYDEVFYTSSQVGRESRTLEYFDSNTGKTKWRTSFPGNLWYWQDEGDKGIHVEIDLGDKMVVYYVDKDTGKITSRHAQGEPAQYY